VGGSIPPARSFCASWKEGGAGAGAALPLFCSGESLTNSPLERIMSMTNTVKLTGKRMRMIVRKLAREYNLKPETVMQLIKTWAKG